MHRLLFTALACLISVSVCGQNCDVFAGYDVTLCNQPIMHQITGNSPGINEGGVGSFYGLGNAIGAVSTDGEFDPSISGNGIFEIVYTFTNAITDCTNSDTLIVSVTYPIIAFAGFDTTVCYNAPLLQLENFSPIIAINWYGETEESQGALLDSETGLINPQLLSPGNHNFIIEFGSGTCYTSDIVTVTVDPLPLIYLGGNDVFCANDDVMQLTTFAPLGGTWEGPGLVDPLLGTFDTGIGVGDWDLFYWYTDPETTCSDTAQHLVTILDIPMVYAGADTAFCNQPIPGQILGYSPGLNQGGIGLFYGLGDASDAVSPSGEVVPSISGVGTFEVVYQFTNSQTACTNTDTLIIVISDPIVTNAGLDTIVCYNAPLLQLEGFYPEIGVLWNGIGLDASNALLDSQTGLIYPQLLPPGDYTYQLENGVGTCYSTDFVTVTISSSPLPVITLGDNDLFCFNEDVMPLTTFSPFGGTWEGAGVIDPTEGSFDTSIGLGNWELVYWYTDPETNCTDTVEHLVTVLPLPVVYVEDFNLCDPIGPVQITNYSPPLNEFGISYFYGLGNAENNVSLEGLINTDELGYGSFEIVYWHTSSFFNSCSNSDTLDIIIYSPFEDFDCNGNCIVEIDALGVCGGDCSADADTDGVCDDIDACVGAYDECGVCNGPGAIYECGCADIPDGECDCNGNVLDDCNVCDGDNSSCTGCILSWACNYDSLATIAGFCQFPEFPYDCDGNCLNDSDLDGICDEFEVSGCMDMEACNYNSEAEISDMSCIFIGDSCDDNDITTANDIYNENCICEGIVIGGCMNINACNYSEEATMDDDSCILIGDSCDDNDITTANDIYNENCICEGFVISGCMEYEACNYSEIATINNNSCIFIGDPCDDLNPLTFEDYVDEDCFCGGIEITTIYDLEALQVRIYPNPASNNLTVDLGDLNGVNTTIKLYDASSKLVFEKQSTSTLTIDVSGFAKGIYSLEISTDEQVLRSQVIVE